MKSTSIPKLFSMLIITIIILTNYSCEKSNNYNSDELIGCWKRNFGASFPLHDMERCESKVWDEADFRDEFVLNEDGTGKYLVLSPTDAHFFQAMAWTYDEATQILVLKRTKNDSFNVKSVTDTGLLLEKR